ncbi:hypothetical protein AMATHDRAFT_59249 [Amanita thiersii Skay4041]|uniref:DUF302 domain-containing protein n=1 Tax=Amanita thiersii Skay4041 TaxID=703135 RepID=A0A2A9NUY3_9AGAR|nr:hypothetical protein AMATHDRAFT_59249 [Amanita thiersii Skay4041]
MSKTITTFTAQLVTFESALPFKDVVTRLDKALNKEGSKQIVPRMGASTSRTEIENLINGICKDNDFLYFLELNHHKWLNIFEGNDNPAAVLYIIGNPLIAQTIIKHDIRAAYNIPPRLLVLEKPDRSGTKLVYHLPSSVMALTDNPELKAAVAILDQKLEDFVKSVIIPDNN